MTTKAKARLKDLAAQLAAGPSTPDPESMAAPASGPGSDSAPDSPSNAQAAEAPEPVEPVTATNPVQQVSAAGPSEPAAPQAATNPVQQVSAAGPAPAAAVRAEPAAAPSAPVQNPAPKARPAPRPAPAAQTLPPATKPVPAPVAAAPVSYPEPPPPASGAPVYGLVIGIIGLIYAFTVLYGGHHPDARQARTPAKAGVAAPALAAAPGKPQPSVPKVETAKFRQEPPIEFSNSIGMKFVKIPKGCYPMGGSQGRTVCLSRDFLLGKTEVTQAQWMALMAENPSKFQGLDLPVEQVSWLDAQAFIKKLNQKEGEKNYRLPTEAEWEYAARADTSGTFAFADGEQPGQYAWYADNGEAKTHAAGQLQANAWGLQDMLGNVFEWTHDWFADIPASPSPANDPAGPPEGSLRVIRGGGWPAGLDALRSAARAGVPPEMRGGALGFRLAKEL